VRLLRAYRRELPLIGQVLSVFQLHAGRSPELPPFIRAAASIF